MRGDKIQLSATKLMMDYRPELIDYNVFRDFLARNTTNKGISRLAFEPRFTHRFLETRPYPSDLE